VRNTSLRQPIEAQMPNAPDDSREEANHEARGTRSKAGSALIVFVVGLICAMMIFAAYSLWWTK
jgi:hypothetical protein